MKCLIRFRKYIAICTLASCFGVFGTCVKRSGTYFDWDARDGLSGQVDVDRLVSDLLDR